MSACLQPKPGNWGDPSWMNVPKPNKGPGSWGDGGPDPNHWNMKRASSHSYFLHTSVFSFRLYDWLCFSLVKVARCEQSRCRFSVNSQR